MATQQSLSLWRNRDYLLLWSGQTISSIGTNISQLAFPLLVLSLTGSPAQAGFAGALRTLPYFLLCLPVGALIDRWDRKRVMILCDSGRALNLASIPIALALGQLTVVQLYLNALIEGTLYVFFHLAETACLPRVVPREQLPAAVAQDGITNGFALLIGPSLGGLLYSLRNMLPFIADAISYVASVISLSFIKTTFQGERPTAHRSLRTEIAEGILWLWHQPLIRSLALLTGIANFVFPESSTLVVIVLARQQHASPSFIGLIFALGSIGYIIGSLLSSPIQHRVSFSRIISGACWLFVGLWSLYAVSPNLIVLAAVTAMISLVDPIYDVTQFSRRAVLIPDELQGRVNSAYRLVALSTPPLGLALAGVLLQYFGTTPTILSYAVCLLVLAVLATFNKDVREA